MQQFWHNDITDKSYTFLQTMQKNYNFVLIGGWAVYLYSRKMKSKDIDIVVSYEELGKLKSLYTLNKNERLHKYEINVGEFDIDIYLPHYSKIGFPLEKINKYITHIEGFRVPQIEVLLGLKTFAYLDRKNSIKGEKDKIDIISLIESVDLD